MTAGSAARGGLEHAGYDVAIDELALLSRGVAQAGRGDAIEVAQAPWVAS